MNEYFQIKHTAEPLTKPYTKSYGHVYYYYNNYNNNLIYNNQIESYINFIEIYDTLCHCVSLLILTLSWDKNLPLRSQTRQTFFQRFRSPLIILFHFFHSLFYAAFPLNSRNRIFRKKNNSVLFWNIRSAFLEVKWRYHWKICKILQIVSIFFLLFYWLKI